MVRRESAHRRCSHSTAKWGNATRGQADMMSHCRAWAIIENPEKA